MPIDATVAEQAYFTGDSGRMSCQHLQLVDGITGSRIRWRIAERYGKVSGWSDWTYGPARTDRNEAVGDWNRRLVLLSRWGFCRSADDPLPAGSAALAAN